MRAKTRKAESAGVVEVSSGLGVARWLWPEFVRVGDGTFLRKAAPSSQRLRAWTQGLLDAEAFFNHTHVLGVFAHRAYFKRAPWFDRRHLDFIAACRLGELMCEAWAVKLHRDFPKENFAVFCTRDDNPIVRFHKIRKDGQLWTDISSCPVGSALLIRSKDGRRVGAIVPPRTNGKPRRTRRPLEGWPLA